MLLFLYLSCKHVPVQELCFDVQSFMLKFERWLETYAKCSSLENAHHLFDHLERKSRGTWNGSIVGYVQFGSRQKALPCTDRCSKDTPCQLMVIHLYTCLMQACGSLGFEDVGQAVPCSNAAARFRNRHHGWCGATFSLSSTRGNTRWNTRRLRSAFCSASWDTPWEGTLFGMEAG